MNRLLKYTGILVWVVVIALGVEYLVDSFTRVSLTVLAILGGISVLYLSLKLLYGKTWFVKMSKQFIVGSDLAQAIEGFLESLPKPEKEEIATLIAHLVYRFTRLTMFALGIAIIPSVLLFQQNQLLSDQNTQMDTQNILIRKQNNHLEQQTYLQEAERRSSLILFSDIMDAIDRELKADIGEKEKRDLSAQLTGRIISLSTRLKPYRYLDGDTLISVPLSPEKGQLLFSLVESKLDSSTLFDILKKADFSKSDLSGLRLNNANLSGVNLEGANLEKTRLSGSNLSYSNLKNANLRYAYLESANLKDANLESADLTKADLGNTSMKGVYLKNTDLGKANLGGADLEKANLKNTNLISSNLSGVNLHDMNIDPSVLSQLQNRQSDSITGSQHIYEHYRIDSLKKNFEIRYYMRKMR